MYNADNMTFFELTKYLEKLEKTSSRLEITQILADLFKKSKVDEIDRIVYLTLGSLAPNYRGMVFNIADKIMLQIIAKACGIDAGRVRESYKKEGDLGVVTEKLLESGKQKNFSSKITVGEIYEELFQIAQDEGGGSVDRKIDQMARLLGKVDPLSARYLVRIPVGKLRLGFSDKTVIDALSWMETGSKVKNKIISEAYNILPDVGLLAKKVRREGIDKACENVLPIVGIPVLPMLAQRLKSPTEMIEKMGKVYVEPKFDGLRVLVHFQKSKDKSGHDLVKAFTRNSNDVTEMFPEILRVGEFINAGAVILDSEAVGMDPQMKLLADFQTTMKRRRVHQIDLTAKEIPLRFQIFDVLYKDGESLMDRPYKERRNILEKLFNDNKLFVVDEKVETSDPEVINEQYRKRIKEGLEGVIVKKIDAKYVAGRTGWRWVKMKQEEQSQGKLSDTVDAVVMGYTLGKGKRAGFGVGQFLVGVVEPSGNIKTLTKIGTGLTDEQFKELAKRLTKLKIGQKPKEYEAHKNYTPDFWVVPKLVVELAGDDLTKSPTHTSGYALRFPRLVNFRDDKSVSQATTVGEVVKLFKLQRK